MNLTLTIIQGKRVVIGGLGARKGGSICTIFCFALARVAMREDSQSCIHKNDFNFHIDLVFS